MQEQQNIDLVKEVYRAFGKGDIDTIIDHLAGQLVWRFDAPSVIPYAWEAVIRSSSGMRSAACGLGKAIWTA
jgi:ketosteroid isomerase-like protein